MCRAEGMDGSSCGKYRSDGGSGQRAWYRKGALAKDRVLESYYNTIRDGNCSHRTDPGLQTALFDQLRRLSSLHLCGLFRTVTPNLSRISTVYSFRCQTRQ